MLKRLVAATAILVLLAGACSDDDDAAPGTTVPRGEVIDPADDPDPTEPADDPDGTDDPDPTEPSNEATVRVQTSFTDVEIAVGGTVTWVNEGTLPHTITSSSGPTEFDEPLDGGATVTMTFDEPGTYEYFCAIHPTMTGTIVVS